MRCTTSITPLQYQRATSVDHSPVARVPVACNAHGVCSHPSGVRMGRAGSPYPTLCALLATTPLTVGEFVRVPHVAVALISLEHGVVGVTVGAVLVGRWHRARRWWRRGWLCGSLDAEPR